MRSIISDISFSIFSLGKTSHTVLPEKIYIYAHRKRKQMKSLIRVNIEPGLILSARHFGIHNLQLFQASYVLQQANHILASRMNKLSRVGNQQRPKLLEIDIDIVSTQTMISLPQANKDDNNQIVAGGERFRDPSTHPVLKSNATDILAFPVVDVLLKNEHTETEKVMRDMLLEELFLEENDQAGLSLFFGRQIINCGNIVCCPVQMLAALGSDSRRCNQVGTMKEYLLCALTHSMLHLFGYDHLTFEQRDEMVAMERKVARCVVEWSR
jgi:ssRNA-specific RNase YbeY (16S rRNA maturation enzyme)